MSSTMTLISFKDKNWVPPDWSNTFKEANTKFLNQNSMSKTKRSHLRDSSFNSEKTFHISKHPYKNISDVSGMYKWTGELPACLNPEAKDETYKLCGLLDDKLQNKLRHEQ